MLVITIREGRNRQVRKMCEAIGHPVDALRRVAIGPIRDERLKPGLWRDLTEPEIRKLRASSNATTMDTKNTKTHLSKPKDRLRGLRDLRGRLFLNPYSSAPTYLATSAISFGAAVAAITAS